MSARKRRAGSTLVLNVLVMTVFAMCAVIVYAAAKSQVTAVVQDARETQAQGIAEAGLEDAMHGVYLDPLWRTGFTEKPFGEGYYTVTLTSANPPFVTSTGYSSYLPLKGRAVRTVSAQLEYTPGACPYAVMGDTEVEIEGLVNAYDTAVTLTPSATEFTTGANIRSNGNVTIGGEACPPAHIWGDITHTGSAIYDAACVTGSVVPTTTTLTVYDPPEPATNDNSKIGLQQPSGANAYSTGMAQKLDVDAGQTVTLSSGVYVFKQMNIASTGILNVDTSSGAVQIYLKNNFNANSGCQINNTSKVPARLTIKGINLGNVVRLNCSTPLHAYLEGNQASFHLEQELYGHFCSKRVEISSATGAVGLVHYDLGGGLLDHVKWTTGPSGSWSESYLRQ